MKDKPKGGMNQKKKKVMKHDDIRADKKLVKKMVKKDCIK